MGFIEKIRNNIWFQRFLRIGQFLSSIISLALFSARLAKIIKLGRIASRSNGAVEGILAVATLYNLITLILSFLLRKGAPRILRWLLIIFDIIFLGAFIAVAYLTRPNGGTSGPCRRTVHGVHVKIPAGQNCNLPWGVFILAIISTILHLLTAVFHEVRDRRKEKKQVEEHYTNSNSGMEQNGHQNGYRN